MQYYYVVVRIAALGRKKKTTSLRRGNVGRCHTAATVAQEWMSPPSNGWLSFKSSQMEGRTIGRNDLSAGGQISRL